MILSRFRNNGRLRRLALVAVLLLALTFYLLAALQVAVGIPLGHGPDEVLHLQYVRHVAQGHGIPTAVLPREDNVASQESIQPPLYYLLTGLTTFWTAQPALAEQGTVLMHRLFGFMIEQGWLRPVSVVYTAPTHFWPQATLFSGYVARLVSISIGGLALFFLFGLFRELTGSRWLGLTGMLWIGWNFNFAYIHAFVTNDASLILLVAAVLWLSVHLLKRSEARGEERRWALLGVLLGALALSKLNALVILPGVALVLAWYARQRGHRALLLVVVPALLVAGGWYLRNLFLYGDPTALRMIAQIEGSKGSFYHDPHGWAFLRDALMNAYREWFFRHERWRVLEAINLLALLGGLVALFRPGNRRLIPLLLLPLLLGVPAYLIWASRFAFATSFRLMLPIWPALGALWVLGFATLVPRRAHALVLVLLAPLLLFHLQSVSARFEPDRPRDVDYTYLPVLETTDHPRLDVPRNVEVGGQLRYLGGSARRFDDQLFVALHWQLVRAVEVEEAVFFVHVIDQASGERVAQADTYIELESLPVYNWRRNQRVITVYRIALPDVPAPLELYTGIYSRQTVQNLPAVEHGQELPGGLLHVMTVPYAGTAGSQ